MSKKGLCGICGKGGKLTEEHIPPECAGNVHGSVVHTFQDWLAADRDSEQMTNGQPRPKGTLWTTLCERCNIEVLGSWYVPDFCRFFQAAIVPLAELFRRSEAELRAIKGPCLTLSGNDSRPLCIVKVIAGMILALNADNDPQFRVEHQPLADFVLDRYALLPSPYRAYLAIHSGPLAVFAPTMLVAPKGRPDEAVTFSAVEQPPFAYILTFDERDPDAKPFLPCGGLHNFAQLPYDKRASFEIDLLIGFRETPLPGIYGQLD